jgi:hypothetical protein
MEGGLSHTPLRVALDGHTEGATRLRLTLQAADGAPYPKLVHVAVTDASQVWCGVVWW